MSIRSPLAMMEDLAAQAPSVPVAIVGDRTWSRQDLAAHARLLARVLATCGVSRGDRVCVIRRNSVLHLGAFLACAALGAILVPVNSRLSPRECRAIVTDCAPRVVLCGPRRSEQLDAPAALDRGIAWVVDDTDPSAEASPASLALSAAWQRLSLLMTAAADARPTERTPVDLSPEDDIIFQYTSGSTGRPRGVRQTVGNLVASWAASSRVLGLGRDDVVLSIASFGHVGGLNTLTLQVALAGGLVVIMRQFDVTAALEQIERHGVTATFGVPTMYEAMVDHPDFATRRLSTLRTALIGGAPVPPRLAEILADRGIGVVISWGMTELAGAGTYLPTDLVGLHPTSVGTASPALELRVVSAVTGNPAPPDRVGELCARGDVVSPGYWGAGAGDHSDIVADDGWFHTHDLARVDAEGLVHLVGRSTDVVISGGENIWPAEVERLLSTHPAVARVCVVGAPDPTWGEMPVAIVEPRPGHPAPTLEELRDHLAGRLARFKLPRRLVLVEELPLGSTGKVDRAALRGLARGLSS